MRIFVNFLVTKVVKVIEPALKRGKVIETILFDEIIIAKLV